MRIAGFQLVSLRLVRSSRNLAAPAFRGLGGPDMREDIPTAVSVQQSASIHNQSHCSERPSDAPGQEQHQSQTSLSITVICDITGSSTRHVPGRARHRGSRPQAQSAAPPSFRLSTFDFPQAVPTITDGQSSSASGTVRNVPDSRPVPGTTASSADWPGRFRREKDFSGGLDVLTGGQIVAITNPAAILPRSPLARSADVSRSATTLPPIALVCTLADLIHHMIIDHDPFRSCSTPFPPRSSLADTNPQHRGIALLSFNGGSFRKPAEPQIHTDTHWRRSSHQRRVLHLPHKTAA
jgi:hypothetical protein